MAVPDRTQTLFCLVFRAHHRVWHAASTEGRAHTRYVNAWISDTSTKRIWSLPLAEAQHYSTSNLVKICNNNIRVLSRTATYVKPDSLCICATYSTNACGNHLTPNVWPCSILGEHPQYINQGYNEGPVCGWLGGVLVPDHGMGTCHNSRCTLNSYTHAVCTLWLWKCPFAD